MFNIALKISFKLLIFLIALFFLLFLTGIISIEDVLAVLNIDQNSNSGKAINNLLSELKLVTNNLFGIIFKII
tara:strand:+ start:12508 stop:12726 length:219 start_codon:yes stop_codon:yes gene_type:complete